MYVQYLDSLQALHHPSSCAGIDSLVVQQGRAKQQRLYYTSSSIVTLLRVLQFQP